MAELPNYMKQY